jgi:hypothetical protein
MAFEATSRKERLRPEIAVRIGAAATLTLGSVLVA